MASAYLTTGREDLAAVIYIHNRVENEMERIKTVRH